MADILPAISLQNISSYSATEIASWLTDNYKEITEAIETLTKELIQSEGTEAPSAANAFFAPDHLANYFESAIAGSQMNPFLNFIAFCATRYSDTSCHKIIFGQHLPIELSGAPLFFVEAMRNLGKEQFAPVIGFLQCPDGSEVKPFVNNPAFIIKERIRELANKNHSYLIPFVSSCTSCSYFSSSIRKNMGEEVLPNYKMYGRSFSSSAGAFVLLLSAAAVYKVSADYLLLPDYSKFAVCNGSPLSWEEQAALSVFLTAPIDIRNDAMKKIWRLLADLR